MGPSAGDDRDRKIEELQNKLSALQGQVMEKPTAAVVSHYTLPPSSSIAKEKDVLEDARKDPFSSPTSWHTVIPSETFATPKSSSLPLNASTDLIDLSTPPRGHRADLASECRQTDASPGYRAVIDELRSEVKMLRSKIPDPPRWSDVDHGETSGHGSEHLHHERGQGAESS